MVSDFKEDGVPTLQNRKDKHIKQELEGFLFQVGMFGHALLPNQFAPSEMSMHSCPTTWCGHPGPFLEMRLQVTQRKHLVTHCVSQQEKLYVNMTENMIRCGSSTVHSETVLFARRSSCD